MKKLIIFFLNLLILVQSQFYNPWYKNLICAGGWYNLDELIAYPDIISIEPDYSPIRFYIDYKILKLNVVKEKHMKIYVLIKK